MQTLVLCMLLSALLPLSAAEKAPKILIYEYESASLPKKSQALRNIFRRDPSQFSKDEFNVIVDIVQGLHTQKSALLGEVPELWQIAIMQQHPKLHAAFPKLKVARAPHKHQTHRASSAVVDEKLHAAASSSAAAASTRLTPHPRKVPLKIHAPGKVIEDQQLVAKLTNLLYQGQYSQVRQYLDEHPDTMNLIWSYRDFNTLLMDLFENPPEKMVGGKATASETLTLIRYLLSKNVNVIYKGKFERNALEVAINYHKNIPREAREEIILKIVDLMLKQGIAPATITHQIQALQDNFQDLITRGEAGSVLTPQARGNYSEFLKDFQENLKLLEAARAPLEALTAEGPLEEAGLLPELRSIVREYRVGEREHKQKAAEIPDKHN
jgi:hypothetical protein